MSAAIRLGTRASQLALTQSRWVAERLEAHTGRRVEFVEIVSEGDVRSGSLAGLGGTGVFATALRDALRAGHCDLVVHSLKDLPVTPAEGLDVASIPERERTEDVLCARGGERLTELPAGAVIGTGSPRRVAQLLRARPDLRVLDIRGNVDTRLGKVHAGQYDAVVLAYAGLSRIDRLDEVSEVFDLLAAPTSPGQGALAIEIRSDDDAMREVVARIDDPASHRGAVLERRVLGHLEAGCAAPIGVSVVGELLVAEVYALDGSASVRVERAIEAPDRDAELAAEVATELLAGGAAEIAPLSPGGNNRA